MKRVVLNSASPDSDENAWLQTQETLKIDHGTVAPFIIDPHGEVFWSVEP